MHRRQLLAAMSACAALGPASRAALAQAAATVRTRVTTELGAFAIEVVPAVAPVTVANYLAYVDGKHLDGSTVYRLVTLANQSPETVHKIEVVQWGMNQPEDKPPPFPPIRHESTRETGLRHRDGTVSMARSTPGSAAGEFFICIGDQPALDFGGGRNPDGQGFAAFGQVVEGMDVVRALHARAGERQFLEQAIPVRTVRRL
jgi:peptidyl-prolyl cis-trans isomerase A (cyclophilin A)